MSGMPGRSDLLGGEGRHLSTPPSYVSPAVDTGVARTRVEPEGASDAGKDAAQCAHDR